MMGFLGRAARFAREHELLRTVGRTAYDRLLNPGRPATDTDPAVPKGILMSRGAAASLVTMIAGGLLAFDIVELTPDQIETWTERLFYIGLIVTGIVSFIGRLGAKTPIAGTRQARAQGARE